MIIHFHWLLHQGLYSSGSFHPERRQIEQTKCLLLKKKKDGWKTASSSLLNIHPQSHRGDKKPLTHISMQIRHTPHGTITLPPRRLLMQQNRLNKQDQLWMSSAVLDPPWNHLQDFGWSSRLGFHPSTGFRVSPSVCCYSVARGEMIHLNSLTAFKQTQKGDAASWRRAPTC